MLKLDDNASQIAPQAATPSAPQNPDARRLPGARAPRERDADRHAPGAVRIGHARLRQDRGHRVPRGGRVRLRAGAAGERSAAPADRRRSKRAEPVPRAGRRPEEHARERAEGRRRHEAERAAGSDAPRRRGAGARRADDAEGAGAGRGSGARHRRAEAEAPRGADQHRSVRVVAAEHARLRPRAGPARAARGALPADGSRRSRRRLVGAAFRRLRAGSKPSPYERPVFLSEFIFPTNTSRLHSVEARRRNEPSLPQPRQPRSRVRTALCGAGPSRRCISPFGSRSRNAYVVSKVWS